MSNTAQHILDAALTLIQTRGFSAISYNDIALELGIRKASIHYHFPGKADLGVAVVSRYFDEFTQAITQAEDAGSGPWQMLEAYFAPYRELSQSADRICLCGALAGEFLALPEPVQEVVSDFFKTHQLWLEKLLQNGRRSGHFTFSGAARKKSTLTISALQGALIVSRATSDSRHVEDVIAALKLQLRSGQ